MELVTLYNIVILQKYDNRMSNIQSVTGDALLERKTGLSSWTCGPDGDHSGGAETEETQHRNENRKN